MPVYCVTCGYAEMRHTVDTPLIDKLGILVILLILSHEAEFTFLHFHQNRI